METYCVSCKRNTENENSIVRKSKQNGLMLLSNAAVYEKKKSTFIKVNKIINNLLLAGDKFIPKLHLEQPGFKYSACGPFTKHRERTQKVRETGNLNIYIETN